MNPQQIVIGLIVIIMIGGMITAWEIRKRQEKEKQEKKHKHG